MSFIRKVFKHIYQCFSNLTNKGKVRYLRKQGCSIGNNVSILCDVDSFSTEPYLISIGNNVRITSGCTFLTHDGASIVASRLDNKPYDKFGCIEIGNNVFIGINTIVMPNVKIGSNVIVGAGSVVTKNIEDGSVVAGVPARRICTTDEYIAKNKDAFDLTRGFSYSQKKKYLYQKYRK